MALNAPITKATSDHFQIVNGSDDSMCLSSVVVFVLVLSVIYFTLANAFSYYTGDEDDKYCSSWAEFFSINNKKKKRRHEGFSSTCDPNKDYTHSSDAKCRLEYLRKKHGVELFGDAFDFSLQEQLISYYLTQAFKPAPMSQTVPKITDTQSFLQMMNLATQNLQDVNTLKQKVDMMNKYVTSSVPVTNTTVIDYNLATLTTIMTIASILLQMYTSIATIHFKAYMDEISVTLNRSKPPTIKTLVLYTICVYMIPFVLQLKQSISDLNNEFTIHISTDKSKPVNISNVTDTVRQQLAQNTQAQLQQISDTSAINAINAQTSEFMKNIASILSSNQLDEKGLIILTYDSYLTTLLQVVSSTYMYALQLAQTSSLTTKNGNNVATLLAYDIINIVFHACAYLQDMHTTLTKLAKDIPITNNNTILQQQQQQQQQSVPVVPRQPSQPRKLL